MVSTHGRPGRAGPAAIPHKLDAALPLAGIAAMRAVKSAFGPGGLRNPGVLFAP